MADLESGVLTLFIGVFFSCPASSSILADGAASIVRPLYELKDIHSLTADHDVLGEIKLQTN